MHCSKEQKLQGMKQLKCVIIDTFWGQKERSVFTLLLGLHIFTVFRVVTIRSFSVSVHVFKFLFLAIMLVTLDFIFLKKLPFKNSHFPFIMTINTFQRSQSGCWTSTHQYAIYFKKAI